MESNLKRERDFTSHVRDWMDGTRVFSSNAFSLKIETHANPCPIWVDSNPSERRTISLKWRCSNPPEDEINIPSSRVEWRIHRFSEYFSKSAFYSKRLLRKQTQSSLCSVLMGSACTLGFLFQFPRRIFVQPESFNEKSSLDRLRLMRERLLFRRDSEKL
jgi:AraC-like DNA-binding protein